jgi:Spy/CpxP family protein refolding chaperone
MKKLIVVVILAVFGVSAAVWAADNDAKQMPRHMPGKKDFLASLHLTDAQKKDLSRLKLETEKKGIDLRAKAATAKLELRHLLMADAPDQKAIEKKLAEVAKAESELRMNRIDGWFAANKLMTPEQQKVWIKALRTGSMRAMEGHRRGMAGMNRPADRPARPAAPRPEM